MAELGTGPPSHLQSRQGSTCGGPELQDSPIRAGQGSAGARGDGGTIHAKESTKLLAHEAVASSAQSGEVAVASVLGSPLGI